MPVIKKRIWRVIDLINWADEYFSLKGFDNPRQEIEWMLTDILDCERFDLYLRFEEPLTSDQLELLHQWVKRRVKKEPLQYITGHCEFYGRTFIINKDVFIPRPETERLVDVAIAILKAANKPTVLDMGTGTGCIAVSLAKEIPNSKITGIDISTVAIEVAKINADVHHATVQFEEMDFILFLTILLCISLEVSLFLIEVLLCNKYSLLFTKLELKYLCKKTISINF